LLQVLDTAGVTAQTLTPRVQQTREFQELQERFRMVFSWAALLGGEPFSPQTILGPDNAFYPNMTADELTALCAQFNSMRQEIQNNMSGVE